MWTELQVRVDGSEKRKTEKHAVQSAKGKQSHWLSRKHQYKIPERILPST